MRPETKEIRELEVRDRVRRYMESPDRTKLRRKMIFEAVMVDMKSCKGSVRAAKTKELAS